jgi:hypothetical protein
MWNNDAHLMVSIFLNTVQLEGSEQYEPQKYAKEYEAHIKDAGLLFQYLGLAKSDSESPLGWKPTPELLEIIAERAARRIKQSSRDAGVEDTIITSLLRDLVFGEGRANTPDQYLAFKALGKLGLMRESADGENLPTLHLRQLFAEAYRDRRANKVKRKTG